MKPKPIDVLIIGAGMYVCGRGTSGCGTVLPAVVQAHQNGLVGRVLVAATAGKSLDILREKLDVINQQLGTAVDIESYPEEGKDFEAFATGLERLGPRGCAIVVVPDHLHYPIARTVLESRRPVLVVKPLTPTYNEAMELVRLCESLDVYGAVEFHKRWDAANLVLRRVVKERRLGRLLYALIEFSQRKVIPQDIFRSWAGQSNVFQYLGVHYVDLLASVLHAVPTRAMAIGQAGFLKQRGIPTYDAVEAIVEWTIPGEEGLLSSTFLVNWIDPDRSSAVSYQSLKIIGTDGRFESDQKRRGVQVVTDDGGVEDINPYFSQFYPEGGDGRPGYFGYGIESIQTFLEDVRRLYDGEITPKDLEPLRPTFRQGLVSTAVCDAVTRSLQAEGAWCDVPR